ncbi:hypothetical protein KEM55_003279 [Ascosphaera atra]|nr:hypothetical protein KEM55_003279 [Ascosphaera atra]
MDASVVVPPVTWDDLQRFQAQHFIVSRDTQAGPEAGPEAAPAQPAEDYDEDAYYYEDYEYDDGLGYYPDGVKRTLTDEQIEIFRHSEIFRIQRKRELALIAEKEKKEEEAKEAEKAGKKASVQPEKAFAHTQTSKPESKGKQQKKRARSGKDGAYNQQRKKHAQQPAASGIREDPRDNPFGRQLIRYDDD